MTFVQIKDMLIEYRQIKNLRHRSLIGLFVRSSLIILSLGISVNSIGQTRSSGFHEQLLANINRSKKDTNRIALQLKLAKYYLLEPNSPPKDIDKTINYLNQAFVLSCQLHAESWKFKTLTLIANYEFKIRDTGKANSTILQVIKYYHEHADLINEARLWKNLADSLNNNSLSNAAKQFDYYHRAEALYSRAHKLTDTDELSIMIAKADIFIYQQKLDSARNESLSGIKMSSLAANKKYIHLFTHDLATSYIYSGMYYRALYYQLKIISSLGTEEDEDAALYLAQTGSTYLYLEMYDKGLFYNRRSLEIYEHTADKEKYSFTILSNIIKSLLELKRPQEALDFLTKHVKNKPPDNINTKGYVLRNYGQCYAALKQNNLANKYYDAMMGNYEQDFSHWIANSFNMNMYINNVCYAIEFFIRTGQYHKAKIYFDRISPCIPKINYVYTKAKVLPLEVKLDSVAGNYQKAFNDLSLYKRINDSIFNSKRSQQIAEIQAQYETTQKEHAIKLLQTQSKAQDLQLKTLHLQRSVTLGSVAVLLLFVGLGYNRYLFKQKTNFELESKQREINLKNESLQSLVFDKDRLIRDKDWLLKEVNHRVKNNLHTVICLLESQALYLENDALKAIQTSQHRIYAMSLIHQKLYQTNEITTINIAIYLKEFISYLAESFGTNESINFELDLQSVNISAAQAIPVALIINEAVTNSIKYAFPNKRRGKIKISVKKENDLILLNVIDDGIGIDPGIIDIELESMGIALIKGLTADLKGDLNIQNLEGTQVEIIFTHDDLFQ